MLKNGLFILIFLPVLVGCVASDTELEAMAQKFASPAIEVSAEELFEEYSEDADSAALRYAGHRLKVTGTVSEVRDDSDNEPLVEFDVCRADYCFEGLTAQFSEKRRAIVYAWNPGQEVTVLCYVPAEEGFDFETVVELRICRPVHAEPLTQTPTNTATPTAGSFASLGAGDEHTCGVKTDGSVVCWGYDFAGQATPPSGSFTSVGAGGVHTCGVKTDGSVACWGFGGDDRLTSPPSGSFTSISVGFRHTCGVKTDGSIACWGQDDYGQAMPPSGSFTSVSAGTYHTCGVKTDGSIACWGAEIFDFDQATPPSGSFASVSAGGVHTCGMKADGSIACWGHGGDGQTTPPADSFASINAGGDHTCGVKADSSIACWGSNQDGDDNFVGQATPPAGSFASISSGRNHTCGVKTDGSIVCWGSNEDGQATPPN